MIIFYIYTLCLKGGQIPAVDGCEANNGVTVLLLLFDNGQFCNKFIRL